MITRPKRRGKRGQLELEWVRDKNGQRRGGSRKGAGRKARDPKRPSARHKRRPDLNPRHPQHVTLRVVDGLGYLRKWHFYRAVRLALFAIYEKDDFRVVHFSIQGNHLHLVCEADNRLALAAGVKAFECSATQRINRVISRRSGTKRRGTVFPDRYHVRAISSVRQMRHTLNYVLNNFRHHGAPGPTLFDGKLDAMSSAVWFPGWKERTTSVMHVPAGYEPPPHCVPHTWLCAEGWKRATPISVWEVPAEKRSLGGAVTARDR